jgi:MSHA biogenesis protein MshQ
MIGVLMRSLMVLLLLLGGCLFDRGGLSPDDMARDTWTVDRGVIPDGPRLDSTSDRDATITDTATDALQIPKDWLHKDYAHRKALTIDHTKVAAPLQDFPVLVRLKDADIEAKAQPDGDDLVFTGADGLTRLHHELERYDSSVPVIIVWVAIPVLPASQDTKLYVYYGNPGCGSQQSPAKVWDAGHAGVWHLNEQVSDGATSGVHTDSTAHGRHGAQVENNDANGKIADGQDFDGNDYIEVSSPSAFVLGDADCTVSAWIRTSTSTDQGILIKADATNHETGDKLFGINHTANKLGIDQGWVGYLAGVTTVNDNAWHHIAWVQKKNASGSDERWDLYVDGNHESTMLADTKPDVAGHTVHIGGRCQGSFFGSRFSGRIDEVRISSVARSAGWLKTSFVNQDAPGTFVSVGVEESLGKP